MGLAILSDVHATWSTPPFINAKYHHAEGVPAGCDATSLIILELPALSPDQLSRRLSPGELPGGKAYAIDLAFFSVNCASGEYDSRLFTKDDMLSQDTVFEALVYTAVDKSVNDVYNRFPIRNSDSPHINRLYLLIQNFGTVDTGPIDIELTYWVTQEISG
jgi:hypothetical protein